MDKNADKNADKPFCVLSVMAMEQLGFKEKLEKYLKEYPGELGRRARLHLYTFDIMTSPAFKIRYNEIYGEIHKYDDEVPGQQEIKELVSRLGWKGFLRALEWFCVNRCKFLVKSGKLTYGFNQLNQIIEKIGQLPKWLK